jgi:lipid-binding SYLF domain-containing protein
MASVQVSIDALHRVLSYLVGERQRLRSNEATPAELEANRRAIVAIQMQLGRALGLQYGSGEPEGEAATSRSSGGGRS